MVSRQVSPTLRIVWPSINTYLLIMVSRSIYIYFNFYHIFNSLSLFLSFISYFVAWFFLFDIFYFIFTPRRVRFYRHAVYFTLIELYYDFLPIKHVPSRSSITLS